MVYSRKAVDFISGRNILPLYN
uniref:Uncharacterized protein n=1 Tax=Anguilla anguilla TaxID=7936 RepID=A0A0E9SCF1_ANGAN